MGKKNQLQGVKSNYNAKKEEKNQSTLINASNNMNNQSTSLQIKSKFNH